MENTQSVVGQIKTVEQNLKVVRGAETLSLGQGAEILAGDQLINESGSLVEVSIHGIEGLYSDTLLKMGPNAKAEVSKIDTGLPDFPPKTGIKALTEDVDLYFAEAEVAGSVIEQYEPPVMGLTGTGLLGAGSSLSALGAVGSIAAFGAAFASGGSSEDAASTPVVENPSGEVPKTPTEPNTPTNPKPIPDPNNPVVTDPDPEVPVDPDPETPTDPDEPVDPQPEPDPETPVDPDPNVPVDPPAPEGLDAVLEGIQTQNPDLVQSGLGDLTEGGLPGLDGGAPSFGSIPELDGVPVPGSSDFDPATLLDGSGLDLGTIIPADSGLPPLDATALESALSGNTMPSELDPESFNQQDPSANLPEGFDGEAIEGFGSVLSALPSDQESAEMFLTGAVEPITSLDQTALEQAITDLQSQMG